jgi:hypothetical protein
MQQSELKPYTFIALTTSERAAVGAPYLEAGAEAGALSGVCFKFTHARYVT